MSVFYSCMAMLFLSTFIVSVISVTMEKTKIVDHGLFHSTTARSTDNCKINRKYFTRNSTDIVPSIILKKFEETSTRPTSPRMGRLKREIYLGKKDFQDDRNNPINRPVFPSGIINPYRNLFDAAKANEAVKEPHLRTLTRRKRKEAGPPFGRSVNQDEVMANHCKNESSVVDNEVDYIYPENHNLQSIQEISLARSLIKKRNKKDFVSKIDDYEITEVYNPTSDSNRENNHQIRDLMDHNPKESSMENDTKEIYSSETNPRDPKNHMQDSTSSRLSSDYHESDQFNFTKIPWPIVPGPIACELDYHLQPSFVAKLGEFDYVVSIQRQENPEEPAEHTCTGVIYNRRFVIMAPHCVNDNYGLSVTSTDDLCTIDEMIDVDYIIEHKNYDPDTRTNDIALLKLKSEIHNKAAKFPIDEDTPDTFFYAVGFGELMWNSFPTKVSKLLQKVPVLRYTQDFQEAPGTLHVTMSLMDLTGTFRGDYGGALINSKGEFVGLKSKLIKKSTEYEVYTKVRDYLPWIKAMVALHGS